MAHDVVQMDYDVMTNVSKGFSTQSKTLQTISKVLQGVIQVLRAMAFLSGGTSAALAQYYQVIKDKIDILAKICQEFAQDLSKAVTDHKNGDVKGKSYFGEGVRG